MTFKQLTPGLSVSAQLTEADVVLAARQGFRSVIDNRPDGEEPGQMPADRMEALAAAHGLAFAHVPAVSGKISDEDVQSMTVALAALELPVLAYCRTGTRSTTLWALGQVGVLPADAILAIAGAADFDLKDLRPRLDARSAQSTPRSDGSKVDVVIVGGGSAGIATAASLLDRDRDLDIVIVEPRTEHYYQPGWTMVGGGIFDAASTCRSEASVVPAGVRWVRGAVATFEPDRDQIMLEDGTIVGYRALVVAPGVSLDWDAIDGLSQALGSNGVTSNYRYDTAPYTWELVRSLRSGIALFTQPPMPIKCAGAPQKAMYLSCDHWGREGRLGDIDVQFHNAGAVLFGVKEYVPALMSYVERYGIDLAFGSTLVAVDGAARRATFHQQDGEVTKDFDMIHVTPPQKAPAFVSRSPLANGNGYVDVDQETLQHVRHANIFGLGDGGSTPNAKTMAAARKQAPVVAENLLSALAGKPLQAVYDGYGSCPLTVERGKIVLAEFGYGGKLLPSFPRWLVDGTKPQRLPWLLKKDLLPFVYWNGMLKGREWLARPERRQAA